ncbi:MAG TPA: hypothetical protein VF345_01240 [Chthoniobacterales bacterium]
MVPALRSVVLVVALSVFVQNAIAVEIYEEIVEQKRVLDPEATLSIHNTDGSIQIYGGDGPEISIQAIKKAYTSDRLKSIVVDVRATTKSVAIETIFPPKKSALSLSDRSGTVDYIVTVPYTIRITKLDLVNGEVLVEGLRGGSATAHLVNGLLAAHNCFGDLDFAIVNGRLEVVYDWWENQKFSVKLSSSHGNIRALIPSDASAGITARTGTGRIANALETQKEIPNEPVHSLDFATEPEPETAFEINSTNGNIRIDKTY